MNKIIKITSVALTAIVLFSGCEDPEQISARKVNTYTANTNIKIYCDKDTNVEYLLYSDYRAGGLTLRVNADGTPKSCK